MLRIDGRMNDKIRPVKITPGYIKHAEGSCLVEMGNTKIICCASIDQKVPPHLKDSGTGWITAEYSMLPRATTTRNQRERARLSGRTFEIQRLIGRALRSAVDLRQLGELTILIDCDVIQADGGTRVAAITGGYVALVEALRAIKTRKSLSSIPVKNQVAAISVGLVNGQMLLDLCYEEDARAEVDMNVVANSNQEFIEIQGTGETRSFTKEELDELLSLAQKGIGELLKIQRAVLK